MINYDGSEMLLIKMFAIIIVLISVVQTLLNNIATHCLEILSAQSNFPRTNWTSIIIEPEQLIYNPTIFSENNFPGN